MSENVFNVGHGVDFEPMKLQVLTVHLRPDTSGSGQPKDPPLIGSSRAASKDERPVSTTQRASSTLKLVEKFRRRTTASFRRG